MKRFLFASLFSIAALAAPAAFAGDVGVSISVGQPGFYGRIDVGNTRPQVIYAEPVVVERVYAPPPPVYLRVPVAHHRHWSRHCRAYGACGRPVYFVREDWYTRTYQRAYYAPPRPVHAYPVYGPAPRYERHEYRRDVWEGRRDWHDRRDWDGRGWNDRRGHDRYDRHEHRGHGHGHHHHHRD